MILHKCIDIDLRRNCMDLWGQKIKGRGHIWSLHFVSFPHDKSIYFWHIIMILHICVDHDLRRTSLDLGLKSRSYLDFKLFTVFFLPFLLDNSISFWHTMMILHTCIKRDPRWTSFDFEVKSLGHILSLNFVPFPQGGPFLDTYYDDMMGSRGQR